MDWNCTFTEERLSDYLEGKLLPAEAAAFSAHAANCANCTQTVALVGGLVNRMRKMPMVEEPPQLVTKILDAMLGPRTQKESWFRWLGWISILWQPRFVMGLGAAVASVVIVSYAAGLTPAKLKKADLSPTNVLRSANRQAHLTYARGAKFVNDLRVVYEIQSALQRTPEPAPATNTAPEPKSESPSAEPDQKSQTSPKPRSQMRSGPMLAFVMMSEFTRSSR
jgi:anti-sigma factor RsiW